MARVAGCPTPPSEPRDSPRRRFRREAFIAGTLNHPHIVEAHDIGVADDGSLYMVLELLQGQDLDARLERMGQLTPERTLGVIAVDASFIYMAGWNAGGVFRMPRGGGPVSTVVVGNVWRLFVDDDAVYYGDHQSSDAAGAIYRIDK